jgi:hypothetical protein
VKKTKAKTEKAGKVRVKRAFFSVSSSSSGRLVLVKPYCRHVQDLASSTCCLTTVMYPAMVLALPLAGNSS